MATLSSETGTGSHAESDARPTARANALWLFDPAWLVEGAGEAVRVLSRLLHVLIVGTAVLVVAYSPLLLDNPRTCLLASCSLAVWGVALWLAARRPGVALLLTNCFLLGLSLFAISTGDGIHDLGIALFPIYYLVAGLLMAGRAYAFFAVTSLVGVGLTAFAESRGWIYNKFSASLNPTDPLLLLTLLGASAWLTRVLARWLLGAVLRSHEARRALEASEQKYRTIFDAASDAMLVFDTEGGLLDANARVTDLLGLPLEKVMKSWPDGCLRGEVAADEFRDRVRRVSEGQAQFFEWQIRRPNGVTVTAEVAVRAGTIGGRDRVFAVIRDVSERKRSEVEQQRLEDMLRDAQNMDAVGRLAGGVAHDFNNMLTVILGSAQLCLDEEGLSKFARDRVREVVDAATRSADLTRQLLAFARRQTVSPKTLDLNESIEAMLSMLRRLVGERVSLDWRPAADVWPVRLDPSQLDQVVTNLCVNANDAISGSGTVTIETDAVRIDEAFCQNVTDAKPGEYVRLSVVDDGRGIDADLLPNIFEPFFTSKTGGTGLGLSTVYGIARQNGGFVTVSSELGEGASLSLYLPRADAEPSRPKAPDMQPRLQLGGGTVLLVDDEPALLRLGKKLLESLGYQVLAACGPTEALEHAKCPPGSLQLLMTDVVMPGMNGLKLAERIREMHPDVRCVFMSGYASELSSHRGDSSGAVHCLPKPFLREELASKLQQALAPE